MIKETFCDGKYEVIFDETSGEFNALRCGEEWRKLTGDGLIKAMFMEIHESRKEIEELKRQNKLLKDCVEGIAKTKHFKPIDWKIDCELVLQEVNKE